MRVLLRVADSKRIKKEINKLFVPQREVKVTLYPITVIENPKCGCGKEAKYMLEDMSLICEKCLDDTLTNVSKLEETDDLNIPLTETVVKRLRFEWSPDHNRWYSIFGSKLRLKDWNKFIEDLKESLISENPMVCEGEYDKDAKEMTLFI